ncbi:MAG: ribonuclease J [Mycoplasma sp.]
MAKINFLGFGGLNEKDLPCYAVTINGNIFLFDCGLSTPQSAQLGVKKIIPDFSWIVNNANAVKGLFIGTPKYNHFAALPYLVKMIPNLPIYTSEIGAIVIINYFNYLANSTNEKIVRPKIHIMNAMVTQKIAGIPVTPFYVSNYMPKSFGFCLNTPDGAIIYIDDFMISSNRNSAFEDQIFQINRLSKGRNLALITGVGNISINRGFTNPSHRTVDFFNDIIGNNIDGRTIIACHDYDLYTIMTVASVCARRNKPFIIYSGNTNRTFQAILKKGYLHNKNLKTIPHTEMEKINNAVIVISGIPQRLLNKIDDITSGEDKLLKIHPTDTFVYATRTLNGYEKAEAEMFDAIVRSNANKVVKLPKEIILATASAEDHKFLIDLLRPKYAIPVNGLYMNFLQYRNAVSKSFIHANNVLILNNGEQIEFINGALQKNTKYIKQVLQFVNSTGGVDSGSVSIIEREQMANNGVVIINLLVDRKEKTILNKNIETIGVTNNNGETGKVLDEIYEHNLNIIGEYLKENLNEKSFDIVELRYFIQKIFTRQFDKKFRKQPLVLSTVVFKKTAKTNNEKQDQEEEIENLKNNE